MARAVPLDDKERELIKPMQLLSYKPTIYVANISEEFIRRPLSEKSALYRAGSTRERGKRGDYCRLCRNRSRNCRAGRGGAEVVIEDLGLTESGLDKLIRSSYRLLGLISYLTARPEGGSCVDDHGGDEGAGRRRQDPYRF